MMRGQRKQRATVMILVMALIMIAGGLVVAVGAAVAKQSHTTCAESDRAVLRQMIDSAVAWAELHSRAWPAADGNANNVTIETGWGPTDKRKTTTTITPLVVDKGVVRKVRVEAQLTRRRGPDVQRVVTAIIGD